MAADRAGVNVNACSRPMACLRVLMLSLGSAMLADGAGRDDCRSLLSAEKLPTLLRGV